MRWMRDGGFFRRCANGAVSCIVGVSCTIKITPTPSAGLNFRRDLHAVSKSAAGILCSTRLINTYGAVERPIESQYFITFGHAA